MNARALLASEVAKRAGDPAIFCTTTALAIATGIGPRSVLRTLEAMEADGEVERHEATNAYRRQITVWRPVEREGAE